MRNYDWKRLHGGAWAHADLLAHHIMVNLHWSKAQFRCLLPHENFQIPPSWNSSLYCFSLYLLENHSLGPVLEFLNYLLLRPPAQLVRETGTRSDILCPKLLAGVWHVLKSAMLLNWCEETVFFFFFCLLRIVFSVLTASFSKHSVW